MKQHYCPVEKSQMEYEGECNWCGEKEQAEKQMTDLEKELTRQMREMSKELSAIRERLAVVEYKIMIGPQNNPLAPPWVVTCATGSTGIAGRD